jgi:hypothetical protein
MSKLKFLIASLASVLFSSCAQNKYVDIQTSGLKHSSPDVISLYEIENQKQKSQAGSEGFFSKLLDGFLASSPDDDDFFPESDSHPGRNDSPESQRNFISENGESLRDKLESKKQE